jgi:CRISPR-associated protein Csd1
MVLQALNRYYDLLLEDPKTEIAPFGYSMVGVSFALNLSPQGELLDILPLFDQVQRGKNLIDVPRQMMLPQQVKRSVNIAPNFLWDNCAYVLGVSSNDDEKPLYSLDRFQAFRELHIRLLENSDSLAARALVAFIRQHDPTVAHQHSAIGKHLEALLPGGNLVFRVNETFVHEDAGVRQIWDAYKADQGEIRMQCLVTGKTVPIARLHPNLKRIRGAQSIGATLVGFNASSYESYNRSQGSNAPVSEKATFAYTTILNHLLSDANPNKKFYLGDTTAVYWAESENRTYESVFASIFDPSFEKETDGQEARREVEQALKEVGEKVKRGQMLDLDALLADLKGENPRFYVLGLAPNAARVSIRFFVTDPFEKIVQNIMAHYRDLEIVKEYEDQPDYLAVGRVLYETVSKKSRDKQVAPLLAGTVFRSILTNSPYPAALYYSILNRIRADMDDSSSGIRKINYVRAAVIKAFLIRKYRHRPTNPYKEVLVMALNEQSSIPAYLLGRLFAVLEKTQQEAIGEVNASIKDRYFTSACASPRSVFPTLLRLSQHHIAKAEYGYVNDRRIQEILNQLDVEKNPIPARLTLDEQGIFVLGYYHQRAAFFTKKKSQLDEISQSEI